MDERKPELLPCPFCGDKAGYHVSGLKGYVYCTGCGVTTDGSYTHREPDWAEEETRFWNQRVYPPEVQNAIEKQKPKKLKKDTGAPHYRCPNCDAKLSTYYMHICCEYCGQKLDWSD